MADSKLNKEEWMEWIRHPVTEQFYQDFQDKINSETWGLVESAGEHPFADARSSGRILAWGELLNWKPEEMLETEETDSED